MAFQTKQGKAVPHRGMVSLLVTLLLANKHSASVF